MNEKAESFGFSSVGLLKEKAESFGFSSDGFAKEKADSFGLSSDGLARVDGLASGLLAATLVGEIPVSLIPLHVSSNEES